MTQTTQLGEAELDTFIRVDRADGNTEFFRVFGGRTISITAEEYATMEVK